MEARSAVTLRAVARIAGVLYRLRAVALAVALAAAAGFVLSVLDSSASSTRSLVALSVLLWAALALGAGSTLVRPPQPVSAADGRLERWRKHGLGLLYWLTTLAFVALAGFSLMMSLRALRLILD